jgi:tetratricopeptide (TPR) repeat protein
MALTIASIIMFAVIVTSLWSAGSGYLDGRTHVGWALLLAFIIAYIEFCMLLYSTIDRPDVAILAMALSSLLLATQGPLLLELISKSVMPDPSQGLKLLKVHTEAERKVAEEDLPGAIAEYEKVIAQDPDDIAARFRLAELCHQNKEYQKTVEVYKALVGLKEKLDANQYCSALMRLSEIHAQDLADIDGAREYLETIIKEYAGLKYAGYAMDRLKNLQ